MTCSLDLSKWTKRTVFLQNTSGKPNAEWLDNTTRLRTFIADTCAHPPGMALSRTAWIRLNCLHTGVGRFCCMLAQMGYGLSRAEERTVDHVVLQCPTHRTPHGLYGLTVLDNETIE